MTLCFSQTFLDSSIKPDDKDLVIDGHNLIQADHPDNTKRELLSVFTIENH